MMLAPAFLDCVTYFQSKGVQSVMLSNKLLLLIYCLCTEVKIISGGIDAKVDPHTGSIVPGFGDFVSRYNGS